MQKVLLVILVLLLGGMGTTYAQDPGIPDTVNFGECQSYVIAEGDSLYGKVKVPLRIFNDESLGIIGICLKWEGPLNFDSGFFYGSRVDSIDASNFPFDNDSKTIAITAGNFSGGAILQDTGVFFFMIFQVFDTGIAKIDTRFAVAPECPFYIYSSQDEQIIPVFEAKLFNLVKSETIPGDLNGNNLVNSEDVIILINFLFRNQYQGFLLPAADVNSDCRIRLSDVIYLINFIFKASERPKPGCAF